MDDLIVRASAPFRREVSAGTGVHRCHEHEIRRIGIGSVDAGYRDPLVLHGLAERIQSTARELRQFIQEQHAVMREGDLARLGVVNIPRS